MTIDEINSNIENINQINNLKDGEVYVYSATLSFLQLDDYVIHRVELLNKSYDHSVLNSSIELSGISIGDLFYLKNQTFEISTLSNSQFYIFLSECEVTDLTLLHYKFKYDYILIHKDYIDEFHLKYSSNSAVWGGFKLAENSNVMNY
ncbi:hypothetical protein [Flavobacterium macrobrachii]|uniref:Uncharacterized protein n=1 Tax=Flavobacterium macrobrachii TaxID=591204 RepID=A0ABS2CWD1_9FLAO|nr:hypothetical protein [Flavobacterium macrobrachii]MBM6499264.1 hypothetical protein [Flavobacterium macrobrachii]